MGAPFFCLRTRAASSLRGFSVNPLTWGSSCALGRHGQGSGPAPPAGSHPQGHQTRAYPGGPGKRGSLAHRIRHRDPMPRERQAPEPPEVLAGTLAYMAPEQTGRMNRSIDARSDLYSLGVTFYQMLTGDASVHGQRSHGVGPLPHRKKAGAAQRAAQGLSRPPSPRSS